MSGFWMEELKNIEGLILEVHHDWTGNPIDRLKVTVVPEQAGLYAWELADRLTRGDPLIQVRDDLIEHGIFSSTRATSDRARKKLSAPASGRKWTRPAPGATVWPMTCPNAGTAGMTRPSVGRTDRGINRRRPGQTLAVAPQK